MPDKKETNLATRCRWLGLLLEPSAPICDAHKSIRNKVKREGKHLQAESLKSR